MDIDKLLRYSVEHNASDLHLSAGLVPMVRIDGDLIAIEGEPLITSDTLFKALTNLMSDELASHFKTDHEADFSYHIDGLSRFRVNAFQQSRGPGAVFRTIPDKAASLEELGAPEIFKTLCDKPHGMILITGPTGSGKSTTMAAMVDYINETRAEHIITIENPIEFVHQPKKCVINQREVGANTKSFQAALKASLREDPDIILVGEMRDIESIRLAITAAETGHLVISTLHTNSAPKTVDRIINVFPAGEQNLIRGMLSISLQAVITQTLLKKKGGGRVAAHEIMVCNHAVANLIRENKIEQIPSAMQTGMRDGMQTMEKAIEKLDAEGLLAK